MRFAVIENGSVVNVIEAEEGFSLPGKSLVATDTGNIGDAWDGNAFVAPAPPPLPVPQRVSNFQGRAMLHATGLFDAVQAAITATGDKIAQEAFERADFDRNSPLLLSVVQQLGKTDADLDEMFHAAASINV